MKQYESPAVELIEIAVVSKILGGSGSGQNPGDGEDPHKIPFEY